MVLDKDFFDRVASLGRDERVFGVNAYLSIAEADGKLLFVSISGKSFVRVLSAQCDDRLYSGRKVVLECSDPSHGPVAYLVDEKTESLVYRFTENNA